MGSEKEKMFLFSKEKKGFTLIELLAVIVILAILALIVTPIILNVIEDTKKNSFEVSAKNTAEAAFNHYSVESLDFGNEDICYVSNFSNDIEEKTLLEENEEGDTHIYYQIPTSMLKLSGKQISIGKITVCEDYKEVYLSDGTYTYVLNRQGNTTVSSGAADEADTTAPIIKNITVTSTSNSITVIIDAYENIGTIKKYSFSTDGVNYIDSNLSHYTFNDLGNNTNYTIYVKVLNSNNLESSGITEIQTVSVIHHQY